MSDELFRQGERLTAAKLNRLLTGTRATSVVSDELDGFGDTPGTIVIRETDGWEALGPGTDGQVLTIGADSIPGWENPATSGTVTSVAVSGGTTGLTTSGGPITSTGTITLAGTLAVANGGTGATTAGGALTNLGVSAFAQTVLDDANAAAARTTLGANDAGNLTTGTVAVARLGSGSPSSTTYLRGDGAWTARGGDLALSFGGTMTNAEILYRLVTRTAFTLLASSGNSPKASASVAATGSTTVALKKNGSSIGTVAWGASGTSGTVTISSSASFAADDVLTVEGPATADATLANVSITLPFTWG